MSWVAYVRGDWFNDEIALAMRKAGCHQVLMGIETGSAEIARRIGKPIDRERYKQAVTIAHRHGIEVRGSFIIGNMGETWETMEETLRFAIELDIALFQLSISTPYPGTALYKEAHEKGWLLDADWSDYGQSKVLVRQSQLPAEDIYRVERYAFRKFYMRPTAGLRMLKRLTNLRQLRDYGITAMMLLLGRHKRKDSHNREDWRYLKEADFFDVALAEPASLRLTYQLRQETMSV